MISNQTCTQSTKIHSSQLTNPLRNSQKKCQKIINSLTNKFPINHNSQKMQQIQSSKPHPKKHQLCRFYLRGLCIYKSSQCHNSHGVWDLHYQPWKDGEHVQYDYTKIDRACREMAQKVQKSYRNLYDYQIQKIFTLAELNADREKRQLIRNQMHSDMFNQFMDLLECYYPDTNFTEDFLLRQFTRVGFNKSMSVIKITHICSYICDPPNSRYFKINLLLPPLLTKQQTYILRCLPDEQIQKFYRNSYEQHIQRMLAQNRKQELNQASLKKYLFGIYRPKINMLPLNLYLKSKKMGFAAFLKSLGSQDQSGVGSQIVEIDGKVLLSSAAKYIEDDVENGKGWSTWSDVFKFIGQQHKINNANITNPLKPILIQDGYLFLNFPMIQFITSSKRITNWQYEPNTVCQCPYKNIYAKQELMLQFLGLEDTENYNQKQKQEELPPKQTFQVYNLQTFLKCARSLLRSSVLGVDLEGRLRRNGFIQMIQINTGSNTFLIDIQVILQNGQIQTFQLCKKLLRNLFCDPSILKIFHDCRHDSLVLHEIMNTCIINIFDTSVIETLKGQLEVYSTVKNCKEILKTVSNVKTPGFNDLLRKYNAPHGINKNKEWFHQLWRKGHTELFEKRPLDPEYRDYCIRDVLDILYLHNKMSKGLCPNFTNWLSSHYVSQGYQYTLDKEVETK